MNWNSGFGNYRVEQLYTAYAHKSYSICNVIFREFFPSEPSTIFGCGIRKIMNEYDTYQCCGTVISMGKNIRGNGDNGVLPALSKPRVDTLLTLLL